MKVHYCVIPMEQEFSPLIRTLSRGGNLEPLSRMAEGQLHGQDSNVVTGRSNQGGSLQGWTTWASGFDGSLALALFGSAVLNVVVGGGAYVTFGTALSPPLVGRAEPVAGCDTLSPYMCDNVVKNVSPGIAQVSS